LKTFIFDSHYGRTSFIRTLSIGGAVTSILVIMIAGDFTKVAYGDGFYRWSPKSNHCIARYRTYYGPTFGRCFQRPCRIQPVVVPVDCDFGYFQPSWRQLSVNRRYVACEVQAADEGLQEPVVNELPMVLPEPLPKEQ